MFEHYPDVLNVAELQKALGIGKSLAYRLLRKGTIRHLTIGKKIMIPRKYLIDYIEMACYTEGAVDHLPSTEVKKE